MQVYRFLDIGTAKPSLAERARVPHHLFDIVTPDVIYSAGRFAREARACAAQVHARGKLAILVGGTGLYIRAFLKGMIEAGGVDAALRERLEQEHERAVKEGDPLRLHRRLQAQDPDAALRIHPNDLRRIVRALEIRSLSGEPASRLQLDHAFGDRPYDTLHVALDPGVEEIDARIDRRCQQMIDAGLLREVRSLHDRGYGPGLRSMRGIGYRHVNPVAEGSDTLANALVAMQRDTRRFARRQRTWLRKVDEAIWIDPRRPNDLMRAVEQFVSAPSGDSEESLGGGTAGRISRPAPGS
jgi:tRNA dimethylallyltransferase